jgi:hypothetical protein
MAGAQQRVRFVSVDGRDGLLLVAAVHTKTRLTLVNPDASDLLLYACNVTVSNIRCTQKLCLPAGHCRRHCCRDGWMDDLWWDGLVSTCDLPSRLYWHGSLPSPGCKSSGNTFFIGIMLDSVSLMLVLAKKSSLWPSMLRRHCLSGNRPIIAPGHLFWTQVGA